MLLKKFYDPMDLVRYTAEYETAYQEAIDSVEWGPNPDPAAVAAFASKQMENVHIRPPKIDYISLAHTGISPEQNFSVRLVTEYLQTGFMSISGDELFFYVHPETLHFEIIRRPGRYCLHCGEKLPDDTGGALARLHVAEKHTGVASPNPDNSAGYVAINHFACVLNAEQHEKWKSVPGKVHYDFAVKEG
jgi:hypothetical protein